MLCKLNIVLNHLNGTAFNYFETLRKVGKIDATIDILARKYNSDPSLHRKLILDLSIKNDSFQMINLAIKFPALAELINKSKMYLPAEVRIEIF